MEQKTNFELIEELLEYIDSNISKGCQIEELAPRLFLSKYQFQRVFKSFMDEPICSYIKRRRLEISAKQIAYSKDEKIFDILMKLGFNSKSDFSKEFKKYFGIAPSEFRKENLKEYDNLLIKNVSKMEIKAEIVQLNKTKIIYVKEFGNYSKASKKAWEKLERVLDKNGVSTESTEFYGIIHDDDTITESIDCRYDACVSNINSNEQTAGILEKEILEGAYAKFIHKGAYNNIEKTYDDIFGNWFIKTEYKIDSTPIIEKYLNNPYEVEDFELLTEIYIPLK